MTLTKKLKTSILFLAPFLFICNLSGFDIDEYIDRFTLFTELPEQIQDAINNNKVRLAQAENTEERVSEYLTKTYKTNFILDTDKTPQLIADSKKIRADIEKNYHKNVNYIKNLQDEKARITGRITELTIYKESRRLILDDQKFTRTKNNVEFRTKQNLKKIKQDIKKLEIEIEALKNLLSKINERLRKLKFSARGIIEERETIQIPTAAGIGFAPKFRTAKGKVTRLLRKIDEPVHLLTEEQITANSDTLNLVQEGIGEIRSAWQNLQRETPVTINDEFRTTINGISTGIGTMLGGLNNNQKQFLEKPLQKISESIDILQRKVDEITNDNQAPVQEVNQILSESGILSQDLKTLAQLFEINMADFQTNFDDNDNLLQALKEEIANAETNDENSIDSLIKKLEQSDLISESFINLEKHQREITKAVQTIDELREKIRIFVGRTKNLESIADFWTDPRKMEIRELKFKSSDLEQKRSLLARAKEKIINKLQGRLDTAVQRRKMTRIGRSENISDRDKAILKKIFGEQGDPPNTNPNINDFLAEDTVIENQAQFVWKLLPELADILEEVKSKTATWFTLYAGVIYRSLINEIMAVVKDKISTLKGLTPQNIDAKLDLFLTNLGEADKTTALREAATKINVARNNLRERLENKIAILEKIKEATPRIIVKQPGELRRLLKPYLTAPDNYKIEMSHIRNTFTNIKNQIAELEKLNEKDFSDDANSQFQNILKTINTAADRTNVKIDEYLAPPVMEEAPEEIEAEADSPEQLINQISAPNIEKDVLQTRYNTAKGSITEEIEDPDKLKFLRANSMALDRLLHNPRYNLTVAEMLEYKNDIENLSEQIETLSNSEEVRQDDLHQLRVEIKRLKAALYDLQTDFVHKVDLELDKLKSKLKYQKPTNTADFEALIDSLTNTAERARGQVELLNQLLEEGNIYPSRRNEFLSKTGIQKVHKKGDSIAAKAASEIAKLNNSDLRGTLAAAENLETKRLLELRLLNDLNTAFREGAEQDRQVLYRTILRKLNPNILPEDESKLIEEDKADEIEQEVDDLFTNQIEPINITVLNIEQIVQMEESPIRNISRTSIRNRIKQFKKIIYVLEEYNNRINEEKSKRVSFINPKYWTQEQRNIRQSITTLNTLEKHLSIAKAHIRTVIVAIRRMVNNREKPNLHQLLTNILP